MPVMARNADHFIVLRVLYHPSGNIHTNGYRQEFFQLAQAAKLTQHDLAEYQLGR